MASALCWLPAQEGARGREAGTVPADASASKQGKDSAVPALTIGVVDFAKVFEFYPKAIKERERLKALNNSFSEQMDAMSKRIQELKDQVGLYPEGSLQARMKRLELEGLMQQGPALAKVFNEQLQLEHMRMEVQLYEDVEIAIGKLVAGRGVQLVLRKMATLPLRADDESPSDIQNRLVAYERRHVWFAATEIDLTAEVIKMLQVPLEKPKAPADGRPDGGQKVPAEGPGGGAAKDDTKGKEGL